MAWAYKNSGFKQSTDTKIATTAGIDMSGADTLIVIRSWRYDLKTSLTLSDSQGNTWNDLTLRHSTYDGCQISYAKNASVSASQTFTLDGGVTACYPSIWVAGYSGLDLTTPFSGSENGAGNDSILGTTGIPTGSITPASGELVIAGATLGYNDTGTTTIDSGFTFEQKGTFTAGFAPGGGIADLLGAGSSVNPTIKWSATTAHVAAAIASFVLASGGGGGGLVGPLLRGGRLIGGGPLMKGVLVPNVVPWMRKKELVRPDGSPMRMAA